MGEKLDSVNEWYGAQMHDVSTGKTDKKASFREISPAFLA